MDLPHLVNSGDPITAENMNRAFGAIQMLAGFNQNSGVPFSNAVGKKQKCVDIEEFIRRNRPFSIFHKSEQIGNTCMFTFKQYITDGVIRTNVIEEHDSIIGIAVGHLWSEVSYRFRTTRDLNVGFINQRISTDEHRHTELLTEFDFQKYLGNSEVRHLYIVHDYNTNSEKGADYFIVRKSKMPDDAGCLSEAHYTYLGEQRLCVDWRYVVNGEKEVCAFQSTETEIYFAQRQDWAENIDLVQYKKLSEIRYEQHITIFDEASVCSRCFSGCFVERLSCKPTNEVFKDSAIKVFVPSEFGKHIITGYFTENTIPETPFVPL